MERKDAIQELVKRGAVECGELTIKRATPSDSENGVKICLTIDKSIPGFVKEGDDFVEGTTKQIFIFFSNVTNIMSEDKDCAKIYPYLKTNVFETCSLLEGATVKVFCENVAKDDEYVNPFSDTDRTSTVKRTTIYHHISEIAITDDAVQEIKEIRQDIRRGVIKFNPE